MQVQESEKKVTEASISVIDNVREEMARAARSDDALSLSGYERNLLGRNDGRGHFENISAIVGTDSVLDSRSIASGDVDGDGDLDFVLRNFQNPRLTYMENVHPELGGFLRVKLSGPAANPTGVGAIVRLEADDLVQTQTVTAGTGYMTQLTSILTFGLGSREAVDRLHVRWPDGTEQVVEAPAVGGTVRVAKP